MSWASEELRYADLGDVRLNRRLVEIVEDLGSSPETSVPQASRSVGALQGMYKFWSNRRIHADDILAAHRQSTIERIESYPIVYAIQDTTDLDYTDHPATKGIGKLTGKTRGLKLHSVLCVDSTGVAFGVIHQQVWGRPIARSENKRRQIEEKESYRWIESLRQTEQTIPETTRVITIADREADIYDLFALPRRWNSELLIRIYHERQVQQAEHETVESLSTVLERTEIGGYIDLELQRTPRRKARRAQLGVRWAQVRLQAPNGYSGGGASSVAVNVVWAYEETPPNEKERISWLLVTTLPVRNFAQASEVLKSYNLRWLIERYHYCLKGACRVEELQLSTAERLERAIATYVVVAWRFLYLTYSGRESVNSELGLSDAEREVLYRHYNAGEALPTRMMGLGMFVRWLGQLGGFLGRKSDGAPGAKTIWRGMRRLRDLMAQGGTGVLPVAAGC